MATRNYFIAGDSTQDGEITIWIEDQEVFSGPVQFGEAGTDWRADPAQYHVWSANAGPRLALIEFDTADTAQTSVQMRLRCDAGSIALAEIMWHGPVTVNPLLSTEEREYLGDNDADIPQAVIDSVNAKGGWRVRRGEYMTWPYPAIDIRSNVWINGNEVETQPADLPRTYFELGAGDELTMTLTLPEIPTLDRFTLTDQANLKDTYQSVLGYPLTQSLETWSVGPAGVSDTDLTTSPT